MRWSVGKSSSIPRFDRLVRVNFIASCRVSESLTVCGETCKSTTSPRNFGFLYVGADAEENGWSTRLIQLRFCGVGDGMEAGAGSCPNASVAIATTRIRNATLRLL